ncbi:MAG TPA: hypothetical protein VMD97_12675 [Candidatus Aquilonibacter sp.]|nr:hypothetical protein [Candidatus Aquilonibacter sp.]
MTGPEERDERDDPRMQEFERALSRAMHRVEVRAETAKKFLALADEAERKRVHAGGGLRLIKLSSGGRVFAMPRPRAWMGGAIAAVLALGCFVGAHIHTEHERRVQAERQFEASQRITDEALAHMREQLRAQGISLDQ